jgi:two-component system response regulator NreC
VVKQSASDELARAIRRVAAGQTYLDPLIAERAIGRSGRERGTRGPTSAGHLSRREEEVLHLVALGLLGREIAARLGISVKTVEAHKANAMRKIGLTSRIDVVHYAMLRGWLREA